MSIPFLPVNTPPDSVLIARFQSGDLCVFDKLCHRHYSRIHAVILSVVCNPDDAQDLTQEVFLKAYQQLNAFKCASQFYSWLYRIAVNRCIDHMRRQSKHHVLIDEPFCEETFYRAPANPLAALERGVELDTNEPIQTTLLPNEAAKKQAMERAEQGISQRDIAQETGLSKSEVGRLTAGMSLSAEDKILEIFADGEPHNMLDVVKATKTSVRSFRRATKSAPQIQRVKPQVYQLQKEQHTKHMCEKVPNAPAGNNNSNTLLSKLGHLALFRKSVNSDSTSTPCPLPLRGNL